MTEARPALSPWAGVDGSVLLPASWYGDEGCGKTAMVHRLIGGGGGGQHTANLLG